MRSCRQRKSTEQADFDFDDGEVVKWTRDETVAVTQSSSETSLSLIVEKILGKKVVENEEDSSAAVVMFYIKWRRLSYLHASWERREDIEQVDPQAKNKLKRYLQSFEAIDSVDAEVKLDDDDEVEYFNPEFVEVQRIVSCDTPHVAHAISSDMKPSRKSPRQSMKDMVSNAIADTSEDHVQYLVKWRGQPYSECTWEKWEDLKNNFFSEVQRFWDLQRPPPLSSFNPPHPAVHEYVKLSESPNFGANSSESGLQLRDYQLEGVNWLLWNWWHMRPSILAGKICNCYFVALLIFCFFADEMGLGKIEYF